MDSDDLIQSYILGETKYSDLSAAYDRLEALYSYWSSKEEYFSELPEEVVSAVSKFKLYVQTEAEALQAFLAALNIMGTPLNLE